MKISVPVPRLNAEGCQNKQETALTQRFAPSGWERNEYVVPLQELQGGFLLITCGIPVSYKAPSNTVFTTAEGMPAFNLGTGTLISIFFTACGLRYAAYGLFCNVIGQDKFQLELTSGPMKVDQSHQTAFQAISKWRPEVDWG